MTTVGTIVEEITAELTGTQREELNVLSAAVTDSATSISLTNDTAGATTGAYIAVDDEVMYVWSAASGTVSVRRGMLGTTAAAHDSGALVVINPAFPRGIIKRRIAEEILSWPTGVFAVATETLSITRTVRTSSTALTAPSSCVKRILDVREDRSGVGSWSYESWPRIRHYEVVESLSGTDTLDLQILQDLRGTSVWVAYATAFDVSILTDYIDMTEDIGVPESCLDIVRMGVAMRMIPPREVTRGRQDAQGQMRDAAEIQPGQNSQTAILYKTLRDQRLAEEANRLREKWPTTG